MTHPHLEEIKALARHEAGHYVINRALGFSPGYIKLRLLGPLSLYPESTHALMLPGHDGSCFVDVDQTLSARYDIRNWLERRIQALFAGSLAQSMVDGTPDAEVTEDILLRGNGVADHKLIEAFVFQVRNVECPLLPEMEGRAVQRHAIYERNWLRAWDRVIEEASVIIALAEVIVRSTLSNTLHPRLGPSEPQEPGVLPAQVINDLGVIKARFGTA